MSYLQTSGVTREDSVGPESRLPTPWTFTLSTQSPRRASPGPVVNIPQE